MTKNNTKQTQTPSNDGEILDSKLNSNSESTTTEPITSNLENSQEEVTPADFDQPEDVVSLDNNDSKITETKIVIKEIELPITSSKNITSTRRYKVILSSDTKYVLDLEEQGGYSASHTKYTKSLNFKAGDFIEIPKQEGN